MRKALWCLFLASAAAFAQSTPDNAASEALRKRIQSIDLLNLKTPKPITLAGPVTIAPKLCSIPLLNVVPPGTRDKMPTIQPQGKVLKGDTVQVPAPACGANLFTNK